MDIIGYIINGAVLVGFYFAADLLFGNELETLLTRTTA